MTLNTSEEGYRDLCDFLLLTEDRDLETGKFLMTYATLHEVFDGKTLLTRIREASSAFRLDRDKFEAGNADKKYPKWDPRWKPDIRPFFCSLFFNCIQFTHRIPDEADISHLLKTYWPKEPSLQLPWRTERTVNGRIHNAVMGNLRDIATGAELLLIRPKARYVKDYSKDIHDKTDFCYEERTASVPCTLKAARYSDHDNTKVEGERSKYKLIREVGSNPFGLEIPSKADLQDLAKHLGSLLHAPNPSPIQ
jgi:hypothetical protein